MLWWTYSSSEPQSVLAAIHSMNQPLKGKTVLLLHKGMSCPRRGFLESFDDFAVHLLSENFTYSSSVPVCTGCHPFNESATEGQNRFAVAQGHVLSTSRFPWGFWWFCGALALGKFYITLFQVVQFPSNFQQMFFKQPTLRQKANYPKENEADRPHVVIAKIWFSPFSRQWQYKGNNERTKNKDKQTNVLW